MNITGRGGVSSFSFPSAMIPAWGQGFKRAPLRSGPEPGQAASLLSGDPGERDWDGQAAPRPTPLQGSLNNPRWRAPVYAKSLQLRPTLYDAMDCSPPGSSVHEILQARILECIATFSSRGSSQPRDPTLVAYISCISRRVLYHWAIGEAHAPEEVHNIFLLVFSLNIFSKQSSTSCHISYVNESL